MSQASGFPAFSGGSHRGDIYHRTITGQIFNDALTHQFIFTKQMNMNFIRAIFARPIQNPAISSQAGDISRLSRPHNLAVTV
ncbi:MAG: hypothetical protein K8F25_05245 [Fimbriimonadaceae bacterium]|nr:hypothetical protein [Alphaproteobacteria bacterium]